MAAVDSFWNDYQGKKNVSFDGKAANAGQCVQSVAFYVRDYLHLPVFYADAVYWFTNFETSPLAGSFEKIANTPSNSPQKGDVIIWASNLPNSGDAGHIAVAWSSSPGYFVSIDSNWAGKYVHMVSHNYDYVLGWLRPKSNSAPAQGDEMVIPDQDNWYARFRQLTQDLRATQDYKPRDLSRDEFRKNFVGVEAFHMVEILSDSDEAIAARHAQDVGLTAVRDKWDQQIYGLEDQLKVSQDISNKLNQAVVDAQNASKADLQAALAKVADLTAQLQTSNDKLVDVKNQQQQDTDTGNSFLRWLGNQLNKLGK